MMRIPAASLEYVRVQIHGTEAGVQIDPNPDAVSIAVVATGTQPVVLSWQPATWETDATTIPPTYYARRTVTALAVGVWDVWVRWIDTSETPVRRAGSIEIY